MPTSTTAPPTRRVPGWERVLDAFMARPDRTLTNVELGQIPGVRAFHQRLTDLSRYGYLLTPAILVKKGCYAYTLIGIAVDRVAGAPADDMPHVGALPKIWYRDERDAVERAAAEILENAEALLERCAPAVEVVGAQARAIRDARATLQDALPKDRLADMDAQSRDDLLVLAHGTRDEMAALRVERDEFGAEASRTGSALIGVLALLGDHGTHLATTGAAVDIVAWARERLAERAPTAAPRAARKPRPDRASTGPQLMRKALEHHEQPMHSAKIAEWVMANGGADIYRGATPASSMAAQLAVSNKAGGEFVKVKPGCYGLREWAGRPGAAGPDGVAAQDEFGNDLLDLEPVR